MNELEIETSVGMSRKWDAREAGREVAINTLEGLKKAPNFFLLFSTIHYEKNGGFQEFLNGVWEILPKSTPLIGGTVAGFINAQGCFTRGTSAIAMYYPRMQVNIGIGKNTKRFPKLAGRLCAKDILTKRSNLNQSNYKLCLNFISGVTMISLPGKRRVVILKNKLLAMLSLLLLKISTTVFQKGVAREEDVLESLINVLGKDTYLFGGSTVDDNHFSRSYQFAENKVYKDSIVVLDISIDKKPLIKNAHGFIPTDLSFNNIELTAWKRMIKKIDGEPAVEKYLKTLNWSSDLIDETNFHRRLIFNPLGSMDDDNFIHPFVPGGFLGNSYVTGCPITSDKIYLLKASGKNLISAVEDVLSTINYTSNFYLFTSCASRLETLGRNVYNIQKMLLEKIKKPFLLIYTTGENSHLPNQTIKNLEITFNLLSI